VRHGWHNNGSITIPCHSLRLWHSLCHNDAPVMNEVKRGNKTRESNHFPTMAPIITGKLQRATGTPTIKLISRPLNNNIKTVGLRHLPLAAKVSASAIKRHLMPKDDPMICDVPTPPSASTELIVDTGNVDVVLPTPVPLPMPKDDAMLCDLPTPPWASAGLIANTSSIEVPRDHPILDHVPVVPSTMQESRVDHHAEHVHGDRGPVPTSVVPVVQRAGAVQRVVPPRLIPKPGKRMATRTKRGYNLAFEMKWRLAEYTAAQVRSSLNLRLTDLTANALSWKYTFCAKSTWTSLLGGFSKHQTTSTRSCPR
jgi:hypothetical protein